ncbi:MAG: BadF/BadG/BcrA/BcrD ATPase family protein [Microbacterium sp.]|uniref:BadF/BadG/BcrA/BcrD ATPase family protein n=1 Tax=Microbacterium sp. TaxID=51671 RepID=UPI003BAE159A
MPDPSVDVVVDLGKSRCRAATGARPDRAIRAGAGAPGLAARDGVAAAAAAILPLLQHYRTGIDVLGVGAAGAWAAPEAAAELARRLAAETGARTAVASDVVTAHAGAFEGAAGVLLLAGTGAVALGVDEDVRLVDGWGPELGDFGSGSWLGREALRAVLFADSGLGDDTTLVAVVGELIGAASEIPAWLAEGGPVARRLATLAPLVLDAAAAADPVAAAIAAEAVRLLTASAIAASAGRPLDVVVHGGLTEHGWFHATLEAALRSAGRRVVPAAGDAFDGALLLTRRSDLPHERFVHRAG